MVKGTQQAASSKPAKLAPKQKLSVWDKMRTKGIVPAILNEIKDCEILVARKEKAIVAKELQSEKLRVDAEELRSEVAALKVRIFRNSKS